MSQFTIQAAGRRPRILVRPAVSGYRDANGARISTDLFDNPALI